MARLIVYSNHSLLIISADGKDYAAESHQHKNAQPYYLNDLLVLRSATLARFVFVISNDRTGKLAAVSTTSFPTYLDAQAAGRATLAALELATREEHTLYAETSANAERLITAQFNGVAAWDREAHWS